MNVSPTTPDTCVPLSASVKVTVCAARRVVVVVGRATLAVVLVVVAPGLAVVVVDPGTVVEDVEVDVVLTVVVVVVGDGSSRLLRDPLHAAHSARTPISTPARLTPLTPRPPNVTTIGVTVTGGGPGVLVRDGGA